MWRSVLLASVSAGAAAAIYLLVVILTSPNVPPIYAVRAALRTNHPFMLALSLGYGIFIYTNEELKARGCRIKRLRGAGLGTGASGLGVLLSYLSLTNFGCCGFWLYVMSLLPGFVGVGAATLLIDHQQYFAALALLPLYYVSAGRIRILLRGS
jgi:hypothetical protein